MIRLEGERAYSLDLDDTLINRGRVFRWLIALNAYANPRRIPAVELKDLPEVSIEPVDEPLSGIIERISYAGHANRKMLPGVKPALKNKSAEGYTLYGNTGRPNKRVWVDMTLSTLERGDVADFIENVYFTPEGIKTAVSKAAVISELKKRYSEVEHFDDDPTTVVFLATLFPGNTINLIQHGPTGLLFSRQEHEQCSNIRRVAVIGETMQEREV